MFLGLFFPHNVSIVIAPRISLRFILQLSLLVLASGLSFARTKPKPTAVDSGYVPALAAADRFLHAWLNGDQEDGLVMLSDAVKQHWSEERLQEFFSAGENAAYLISEGKKLKAERYSFPVALLASDGTKGHWHKRFSEIVVMRSGGQDWVVDKLP